MYSAPPYAGYTELMEESESERTHARSPWRRAGETKKRRTHAKLTRAALEVMWQKGMDTRVEDIAEAAGVSAPTFYNFFKSRNDVCMAAFVEHVISAIEQDISDTDTLPERVQKVSTVYGENPHLLRAAMIDYLENHFSDGETPDATINPGGKTYFEFKPGREEHVGPLGYTMKLLAVKELMNAGTITTVEDLDIDQRSETYWMARNWLLWTTAWTLVNTGMCGRMIPVPPPGHLVAFEVSPGGFRFAQEVVALPTQPDA